MIWLDGALVGPADARIDPADRGLLLGDGVFETVRGHAGTAAHLGRHLARLRQGAATLGIAVTWDDACLGRAAEAVLGACGGGDAALRITLTRGPAPRGLLPQDGARPTLLIAASPLPGPLPPARAIIASVTRRNEHSPLSRIKSLNYLDSILARREAATRRADEAVLLNTAGGVAEACAANLFVVADGRVLTPPVADGALPGIGRALVLEAGLAAERTLTLADLRGAQAAFTTSALGVRTLAELDGVALGPPPEALMRSVAGAYARRSPERQS